MRTVLRWYHLVMLGVWAALALPALLWWKNSIILVILLSLYANFGSEFAGYQAARAEQAEAEGTE